MQKQKRKKRNKNKLESEKSITPGKHERIGNLNLFSEEIVKELIDKLISLSMTKIFREKVDSKISNFCFESIIRGLNLTVSLTNINHDKDNIYDIENISDDKKRLNTDENRYRILNNYKHNKVRYKLVEQDMLEYTNINRDFEDEMNLKNKNIDDYLNKSVEYDTIINKTKNSKKNYWGKIIQPNSLGPQRYAPKSNPLNKEILLKNTKNIKKEKEIQKSDKSSKGKCTKLKSLYTKKLSFSSFSLKENDSRIEKNEPIIKKERKYYILEMGDMRKIEDDNKKEETEEIKELRKLKLEKIKFLKEEEEKIKAAKKIIEQSETNLRYNLDSINLTAQEKARKPQVQKKIIEDQIRKGNFTIDFNNNLILVRQVKPDSLEEDFPEAITKQKEKEKKEKEKENLTSKENKDVQTQSENNTNEKTKKKNSLEDKNKNFINYFNFNFNWKVNPSGSNFKLIKPEVGVTIYESGDVKSGGNQFFEKYKRFSINDYSNMLKEIKDQQEMTNILLKKKMEEENKKNNLEKNIKKNKMNISNEISKIKEGLDPFGQRMKNLKVNILNAKKKMNKSQSEIFTRDRTNLYEKLLIKEENIEIKKGNKNKSMFTHKINPNSLFLNRMKNIIGKKNKKSLKMIDTFNKSLISQNFSNSLIDKESNNLPIIPLNKNKSDIFQKKNQYFRARINKSMKANLNE